MTILGTYLLQYHLFIQPTLFPQKVNPTPMGVGSYFDTVNDAHIWHKNYAKFLGFSVRKDELRPDGKRGEVGSW